MWRIVLLLAGAAHAREVDHGVCYAHAWRGDDGYGSATSKATLVRLQTLGVDAISLTPFGYQWSASSESVKLANHMGESDDRLAATTQQAHALGMRVMLKPHIWIRGGTWIGDQSLSDEAAWSRWLASYREFILHYAKLAQAEKMDAFALGTELKRASRRHPEFWRALIAEIRAIYKGRLTYAANWDEAAEVPFWALLDEIGVQEYEPPAQKRGATLAELRAGWTRIAANLESLAKKYDKPIVLTELGYRPIIDAALAPSTWADAPYDGNAQADCYRAALESLSGKPWLRGIYIWKWFTDSRDEDGPTDFSPAGKPAEKVLGEFYRSK
jgi:hypothetical protein